MSWPYRIKFPTPEEKIQNRILLDRYGLYAQLSIFIPVVLYNVYRLAIWVYSERQRSKVDYDALPSSPTSKKKRASRSAEGKRKIRSVVWWLGGEVAPGRGERGQWILAGLWGAWLGFLCVHKTGDDYFHITKRFGIVAASQFPAHYALSMKSLYSPLSVLFGSSHEQLNTWHRISGRVIWTLLACHASWYANGWIQIGVLYIKITTPIIICGILSFWLINLLIVTSLPIVRRWSYRVFFTIHLFVAIAIIPLLFFHATALRIYILEALALFVIDLGIRKFNTVKAFATIKPVPETSLVEVTIPITPSKISQFQYAPGQHVYLSIPPSSVPKSTGYNRHLYELLYNPFTVASVSDSPSPQITLTMRTLNGPTTSALSSLSHLSKARPPLNIEGPYGTSRKFPNLAEKFDRVLLVAGGVGATFTLPIYRAVKQEMENEGRIASHVRMIWVMRDAAESSWALSSSPQNENSEAKIENDQGLELYITSPRTSHSTSTSSFGEPGSVEMHSLASPSSNTKYSRPDLRAIVDGTFCQGLEEKVAVLVCGPTGMARELREHVGKWVEKGREVWWHDEGFGW
ncbi:similar to ferric reductase like transmembrane component [Botrytis cinerea T4]|uniref:ferric-chelate reductase (NADPH) n=1 Tax=Botryotinia fuckeliana (strain T4) TaxID=999810 RepID=G2XRD6_BOTF4|nr:similar to ferric reductase like transmembrane component [Botrytis cinerea T4]